MDLPPNRVIKNKTKEKTKMKKIASLILALVLIVSMATTAFAAEPGDSENIDVSTVSDHCPVYCDVTFIKHN